jgi:outer membrane receptor protein involved in Fe transport
LRFDLNLQNLFDERYWQYYYSQIPPVNGEYLGGAYEDGLPGAPFSATFTVTARF